MRLVAVADTHLFHDELVVPDGDVLVHAGDLCRFGELDELADAARWLRSLPHRVKIVVPGNHDWAFVRAPDEARRLFGDGVIVLQDRGAIIDGLRFWGSPWQPAFMDWAFNLPRGPELAAKWALIPDDTDVLITHGPPAGFGDVVPPKGPQGCVDLLARVRRLRPRLHLYGHIHEDGGLWHDGGTCFANVTTTQCARPPTVIRIDAAAVVGEVVPPAVRHA